MTSSLHFHIPSYPLLKRTLEDINFTEHQVNNHLTLLLKEHLEKTSLLSSLNHFKGFPLSFIDKIKIIFHTKQSSHYSLAHLCELGKYYQRSLELINSRNYHISKDPQINYLTAQNMYNTNFNMAYACFTYAADEDFPEGIYTLGHFLKKYYNSPPFLKLELSKGNQFAIDYRIFHAHSYLEKAAQHDHLDATYTLAELYREGNVHSCPSTTKKQAKYWLTQAANKGHEQATKDLKALSS